MQSNETLMITKPIECSGIATSIKQCFPQDYPHIEHSTARRCYLCDMSRDCHLPPRLVGALIGA